MALSQSTKRLIEKTRSRKNSVNFRTRTKSVYRAKVGLNKNIVEEISTIKNEPAWMRDMRLHAYQLFLQKPMPAWGANLSDIDFNAIHYYVQPQDQQGRKWSDVPKEIKETFDKLGIPQAERKFLAGAGAQFESEVIYHSLAEELKKQGVIFESTEQGLKKYPEIFKKYFGTVIPAHDNKFAALNTATWSGGSFIYVPRGVHVTLPLQAYFRINSERMGQFERTLIIADEGSSLHYVEGCFIAGARVKTRNGEKPIENISIGDEVLTHKGRYRKIYNKMQRLYKGSIYSITYYGDSSANLKVTNEHPLLVVKRERFRERNKKFIPEWLPASGLKEGDYLAVPIPKLKESTEKAAQISFPLGRGRHTPVDQLSNFRFEPDFFRLLGYYFSEGHVDNEHYLSFSFNANEKEYIQDTNNLCAHYFGKAPIANAVRQNGQTFVVCSTSTARPWARSFGSTVYEKHAPEWLLCAPNRLLSQWVRGIWRGDGSYDDKKNVFRFHTISRDVAYTFRDALLKLGIISSVNLQYRDKPRRNIYALIIASPFNEKFGEIVGREAPNGSLSGSPFHLDDEYLYVPIRAIKIEQKETTVYNVSVEEDESYVCEGVISHNCTAPTYSSNSLHSAVVEIIVRKNARVQYTTIQNWSNNVYNLVTKRAIVHEGGEMFWLDCNLGSKVTMKYPCIILRGKGARGEIQSFAFAGKGQHQDTGGKVIHVSPNTSSTIVSKSISKDGGRASYRGLVRVVPGARGVKTHVQCDALLLDERSRSDTYPTMKIEEQDASVAHEATVAKIGAEQLAYAMSRGLDEQQAASQIVNGFALPIVKQLPMEYAVELNRLLELEMKGSVG